MYTSPMKQTVKTAVAGTRAAALLAAPFLYSQSAFAAVGTPNYDCSSGTRSI
ncbi:hypothetical protein [Paenibacillus sp. MMO-58]|uniref:hypothetical protein n=1 Tax=Paenibacillus sp. MMO-58 TaxID=3081290 RepID=UPI003019897A